MNKIRIFFRVFTDAFRCWSSDNVSRLAAALAYYTLFSLAPLLIIVIAIVALVFGEDVAQSQIAGQLEQMVGSEGSSALQNMLLNAQKPAAGIIASLVSIGLLLFAASQLLMELRGGLNHVWHVPPEPETSFGSSMLALVKSRLYLILMVLATGGFFMLLLAVSTSVASLGSYMHGWVTIPTSVLRMTDFIVSFTTVTLLFAIIHKFLPNVEIGWSDVWLGAAVSSLLFTIGKYLIGLYLGRGTISSAYGAAGSLVVLLVWINFSAQVLYFGAELIKSYSEKLGSRQAGEAVPDR